ncbi:hypothetical protein [Rhizobium sp. CCGE 510]|uniref:hypothetical protein n=1 Tax=Rhizobium sp. CCGE 510 TaxID=1132836 RepID=UPI00055AE0F3|nr:hypothetical protein [Rhizobium sp. CCGE 510]
MARPRTPKAKAALTGQSVVRRKKFESRIEPVVDDPLGDPPAFLKPAAAEAWEEFRRLMPWLNRSHRGITELASILQSRQAAGVLAVPGQTLLLRFLGSMGGTPAASRFAVVPEPENEDPAMRYFE